MSGPRPQHDQVYLQLRDALFEGRFAPGEAVTVASVAQTLQAGTMPVREALRRLSAEGGFELSPTRRLRVPRLAPARLDALLQARALLEPQAAAEALPFVDAARLAALEAAEQALVQAVTSGDAAGYMRCNVTFHLMLYRAAPGSVLAPLIERLWLQSGPHMSHLLGMAQSAAAGPDRHQQALQAIRARRPQDLKAAVAADIADARAGLAAIQRPD